MGGWQIQNRATLGATWRTPARPATPSPCSSPWTRWSWPPGRAASREIPYSEFHTGYRKTALRPGEIVARVRLPFPPEGSVQAFRKVGTREAQSISKVVVALAGRVEGGRIAELRLAAGSVAATPVRLRAAEEARPAAASWDQKPRTSPAARRRREVTPIDDVRSTADYRRFALERVVRRMVLELEP